MTVQYCVVRSTEYLEPISMSRQGLMSKTVDWILTKTHAVEIAIAHMNKYIHTYIHTLA